jgi:hypothetical protein
MHRTIPFCEIHLRDRLFRLLSRPMQRWVTRQADQIVRSRRFGLREEMRVDESIQWEVHVFPLRSPLGSTNVALVRSILKFLVLMDAGAALSIQVTQSEQVKNENERQEAMTAFQAADQISSQLFNILSTVMKNEEEMVNDVTRNLSC